MNVAVARLMVGNHRAFALLAAAVVVSAVSCCPAAEKALIGTYVVSETACTLTVPAGGADALQASFQVTPSDSVTFSRLEVALYRKD